MVILVAPSILSSDFSRLREEISAVDVAGADWIHLDVMDGNFVPNLTFGAPVIGKLRPHTDKLFDAHLMMMNPQILLDDFLDAGVDSITLHVESSNDIELKEMIKKIHSAGKKVGICINPETSVKEIELYLDIIDLVLVMSVMPGFGGQSFMPKSLDKIRKLKDIKTNNPDKFSYLIQVDGGINDKTIESVKMAGVDVVVAGSFVFKAENYKLQIDKLKI